MLSTTPSNEAEEESSQGISPEDQLRRLRKKNKEFRASKQSKTSELITREDGTQVIRVKHRKRRSQQKTKDSSTGKKIASILVFSFLILGILGVGAVVLIISKYNGGKFIDETQSNIKSITGADKVTIEKLNVNPIKANADKIEIDWGQYSILDRAEFNSIKGKILVTSFLSKKWHGEGLTAETGKLFFQMPSAEAGKALLQPDFDSPYAFSIYRCKELDVFFGKSNNSPNIKGISAAFKNDRNGDSRISFVDGILNIPQFPKFTIASGVVQFLKEKTTLSLVFGIPQTTEGFIKLVGDLSNRQKNELSFNMSAESLPISYAFFGNSQSIFSGKVDCENGTLTIILDQPTQENTFLELPFSSTNLTVSNLPLFTALRDITNDSNFLRPVFNNASGSIVRSGKTVEVKNLELFTPSLLSIKGNMAIDEKNSLSGSLEVGIPQRFFSKKNPPKAFRGPTRGLYVADVTLSGTIHNPYDNSIQLLTSNAGVTDINTIPKDIEKLSEDHQKSE